MDLEKGIGLRFGFRFHHLYYLLAAVVLATVVICLWLSHQILAIHAESIGEHRQWNALQSRLGELTSVAVTVKAPGNEVFRSGDAAIQRQNLDKAWSEFNLVLGQTRNDLESISSIEDRQNLGGKLSVAESAMKDVRVRAFEILDRFDTNDRTAAGQSRDQMDQQFSSALQSIHQLSRTIGGIQEARVAYESDRSAFLGRYERMILLLLLVTAAALGLYGIRLSSRANHAESLRQSKNLDLVRQFNELKVTQGKLAESEARHRAILDTALDGVITINEQGDIDSFSASAERMFGFSADEIQGQHLNMLMPMIAGGSGEMDLTRICSGEADTVCGRHEFEALRKDGSTFSLELSVSEFRLGNRRMLTGFVQDISERKKTAQLLADQDEKMRQKQKLEAVGSLAGGVAHEFNNLLQVILGFTKFAMQGLDPENQRYQDLEQVLKASDRAVMLTSKLLSFSRTEQATRVDLDVNELMTEMAQLLRPILGERYDCKFRISENLERISADPNGLQQVILNLCVNARDAMSGGGTIRIRVEPIHLSAKYCQVHSLARPGDHVQLSVTDTGIGMTPEQIEHIFEPFYTTKEVGKGTGLGMAIVHGVVKQHQGHINVYSEPGHGTTVRVYFPVEGDTMSIAEIDHLPPATGGSETILFAEDESMVRVMTTRLLQEAGYQVIAARDGEEAVRLFQDNCDTVAIALLDVVMPKMTGREALEQFRKIRPDVKAVFCTGYDPETAQTQKFHTEHLCLLQKPCDPDDLLRAVRQQIDGVPMPKAYAG